MANFSNTIPSLNEKTAKNIHNVMLEASIAFELGKDYKLILLRAKNSMEGASKKVIQYLIRSDDTSMMKRLGRGLTE